MFPQLSIAAIAACKPFAGGLRRSRAAGLAAFAVGKSLSPLPKWLKPQTAQVPGANPLKDAHAPLDAAGLAAYGFSAKKDLSGFGESGGTPTPAAGNFKIVAKVVG